MSGITIQCVSCKAKKTLSLAEAQQQTETPVCDRCYMPMVVISAQVTSRRSKRDLRDVFGTSN